MFINNTDNDLEYFYNKYACSFDTKSSEFSHDSVLIESTVEPYGAAVTQIAHPRWPMCPSGNWVSGFWKIYEHTLW